MVPPVSIPNVDAIICATGVSADMVSRVSIRVHDVNLKTAVRQMANSDSPIPILATNSRLFQHVLP
jgi:hypothetical protein